MSNIVSNWCRSLFFKIKIIIKYHIYENTQNICDSCQSEFHKP